MESCSIVFWNVAVKTAGIVTGPRAGWPENRGWIASEGTDFYRHQRLANIVVALILSGRY
jgi:hypothetical protein